MPSTPTEVSTDSAEAVTLLEETRPMDGVLSVWCNDADSGAGTLIINGESVPVRAGKFSFQTAMYVGRLKVEIQRSGDDDMTGWCAFFSTKSGT